MNLRHAATLALVSWYLMVPPAISNTEVNHGAALPNWEIISSFDSAEACHAMILYLQRTPPKAVPEEEATKPPLGKHYNPTIAQLRDAQCVASDDPRLKRN